MIKFINYLNHHISNKKLLATTLYYILFFLSIHIAYSQDNQRVSNDTLTSKHHSDEFVDSLTNKIDTFNLWRPIRKHNSISPFSLLKTFEINKKEIVKIPYFTLSDILKFYFIGYPISSGFPGLDNKTTFFSGSPEGVDLRYNNISQLIPLNSQTLWSIFPIENIENIEILTGSQAVIIGNNSNGALINLQEIQHHTYKPYTKIWYNQGIDETLSADGMFSQNFAKNFNFLFGFRSLFSPGTFDNQWVENWNIRAKIRWNIDSLSNLSISENFTNYGISQSGGINTNISTNYFDPLNAIPLFAQSDLRLFQHNLNLSYTKLLDIEATSSFASSLSIINNDYTFYDRDGLFFAPSDSSNNFIFNNLTIANNTSYELKFNTLKFKTGADLSYLILDKKNTLSYNNYFDYGIYGFASILPISQLELSGGVRYLNQSNHKGYSFGGRLDYSLENQNRIFLDFSSSSVVPSLINLNYSPNQLNNLILLGIEWNYETTKLNSLFFYRVIQNLLTFEFTYDTLLEKYEIKRNISNTKNYIGLDITTLSQWKNINLELTLKVNFENGTKISEQNFPLMFLNSRIYYSIKSNENYINLGIEGELISPFRGLSYLPLYNGYYRSPVVSSWMVNGLTAFALGKLGNAYVKLLFVNILNQGYYYNPINPEPGRHFQFAFTWAFLD